MDWDDLRFFLAVARTGSLSAASRALGVNHSTVFRRIQAFEERLGVRLFERLPSGYARTVAGDEMLDTASRVEAEVDALDRRISGHDLRLTGPVVVTTTDTMAYRFLGPHLAAFRAAYPGIGLELTLDTQFLNLSRRQADVAIRPTRTPPENLVGRRLSAIAFAVYGSRDYLALHGETEDLSAHAWLAFDDSLAHLAAARWLRDTVPDAAIALRGNNLFALFGAAAAGMGVAALPCFLADPEPALQRLRRPDPALASELWLLTHEDLRHTARIRAFLDFMATALAAERDLLEGRRPA